MQWIMHRTAMLGTAVVLKAASLAGQPDIMNRIHKALPGRLADCATAAYPLPDAQLLSQEGKLPVHSSYMDIWQTVLAPHLRKFISGLNML